MKRYCFDTSGVSNPHELMPEDIHGWMWDWLAGFLKEGHVAVTTEIYEEMCRVPGTIGECINANKKALILEIENGDWDWESYVRNVAELTASQREFISEYNGGRKNTVGLSDISIIALGKTLALPVVSMETLIRDANSKNRHIPCVCQREGVEHMTFNEFLRAENVRKK